MKHSARLPAQDNPPVRVYASATTLEGPRCWRVVSSRFVLDTAHNNNTRDQAALHLYPTHPSLAP
jgi:hypothetical protein